MRITKGPDWSKDVVAEGTSKTLSHFKNMYKGG